MLSTLYALYAVMKDDNSSSVVFLSQTFILWTKRARRSESFRLLGGWVKFTKLLENSMKMSCLKLQVSFSLNFASLLIVFFS